ncbi:unnamed protein product [Cylicocyclus nassatus]|uniref:Uncharacterized protein n=1 Tax=Cylicocyclus nassatus TaxID=53992 RepID=A0AA36GQ45_CYLNA|nr:unnamed protein product [Cylicocyclus nassatus]
MLLVEACLLKQDQRLHSSFAFLFIAGRRKALELGDGDKRNTRKSHDASVTVDYRDTVFIYASHKVLARSLVGRLFRTLEDRNLRPSGMNMVKTTKELVQKSPLLKKVAREDGEVCMFSTWHGEYVFKNALGATSYFCRKYAFIQGVDIVMTETTKATRKEAELWIDTEPPPPLVAPVAVVEDGSAPVAENVEIVEPEEEPNTIVEVVDTEQTASPQEITYPTDAEPVRDTSTADTLPVGDGVEDPIHTDKLPPIQP